MNFDSQAFTLLPVVVLILGWGAWRLVIYPNYLDHLRFLPGPKRKSLLRGNLTEISEGAPGECHRKFLEEAGSSIIRYHAFFGTSHITLTDPKALQHILLSYPYDYPKPQGLRRDLARQLGKGILFAEGDDHRRQKRALSPAFTEVQVRELTDIFYDKTEEMIEKLHSLVEDAPQEVEVTAWLSRITLDIIGLAGFGYDFKALSSENGSGSPLYKAFKALLSHKRRDYFHQSMFTLQNLFPAIGKLPISANRKMDQRMSVMREEGRKIIDSKRSDLNETSKDNKDIISLLLKANARVDSRHQLTDEEIMGQITTFQKAGHETSSSALTLALHHLSLNPGIQLRLRNEMKEAKASLLDGEHISGERISTLPYMDAVLREVLRLSPPVPGTSRKALKDDMLPLAQPVTLRNGETVDSVRIKQGDDIFISISAFNQSRSLWGEDALEFNPERWLKMDGDSSLTSDSQLSFLAASPLLTFLGGPRGCIGFRFSLLEIKIILGELIAHFNFSVPEGRPEIIVGSAITLKILLKGQESKGSQLPLVLTRV